MSATRALLTFGTEVDYGEFHQLALAPYLSSELDSATVVELPPSGPPQRVVEATVARVEAIDSDHALITVAATVEQKQSAVRYLTLPIARDELGRLAVYDLPSFSPPPGTAEVEQPEAEDIEPGAREQLERMLAQFFPIFLAGRPEELRAYLPAGATIAALDHRYEFVELVSLAQSDADEDSERALLAAVKARDTESGALYTLRYHVGVVRSGESGSGWLVEAINGETGGVE